MLRTLRRITSKITWTTSEDTLRHSESRREMSISVDAVGSSELPRVTSQTNQCKRLMSPAY